LALDVPEERQPRRCDDRGRGQGETQVGTRRLSKDAREFRPTQDTALRSPTSTPSSSQMVPGWRTGIQSPAAAEAGAPGAPAPSPKRCRGARPTVARPAALPAPG